MTKWPAITRGLAIPARFHSQLNLDVWIKLRKPLTVPVICGKPIVTV